MSYDSSKDPASADFEESLCNLFFPAGQGPTDLGYPEASRPAIIVLRGGNTNSLVPGSPEQSAAIAMFQKHALAKGWIGLEPNFAVIEPQKGEDFQVSEASVALLIQFLRAHRDAFGVDPNRIVLIGRSAGAVISYAVALRQDYQDLGSSDPVKQESSRPDLAVSIAGPTLLTCFAPWVDGALGVLFFPNQSFPQAAAHAKLVNSPAWWLENPQAFARAKTPPLCLVYNLSDTDVCGSVIDVHSGIFGPLMKQSIEEFAVQSGIPSYGAASILIDSNGLDIDPQLGLLSKWIDGSL